MNKLISLVALATASLLVGGCASLNPKVVDWTSEYDASSNSSGNSSSYSSRQSTDYKDQLSRSLYAAIGAGASRLTPDTSELADWDTNDGVAAAGQITIGADLTKHLSIEGHSADLGSAGLTPVGAINYRVNGVSALVYAGGNRHRYRRQGLTAYGRLGVGMLDNTAVENVPYIQDNATHMLVGAGVEYMTPFGVGLRAEGVSFDKDVQYAQLGMMYRTGKKKAVERPKLAEAPEPIVQPIIAAALPPPLPKPVYVAPVVAPLPVRNRCAELEGVMEGVEFHADSASLTSLSTSVLNEVVNKLSDCTDVMVEVAAHTDSNGSVDYNQSLSERRAKSVVHYLRTRSSIQNTVVPTAFGESNPIDTNATPAGRKKNRRVEIYIR